MKQYKVGDVIMVPATVVEVHPQGFKYGVHTNGGPNMPPHAHPTADEIAEAKTEQPDIVLAAISAAGVEVDAHGQVHFSAAADL